MSKGKKVLGALTATLAGLAGAALFVTALYSLFALFIGGTDRVGEVFAGGPELGPTFLEGVAVVIGLTFGFAGGVLAWSYLAVRRGWFKWEEIFSLVEIGQDEHQ